MKRFAQSQMRDNRCRTGKSSKYGIASEEESSRRKSRTFKYTAARTVELNSESKEGKTPGRILKNASAIGCLSQPSGCVGMNHQMSLKLNCRKTSKHAEDQMTSGRLAPRPGAVENRGSRVAWSSKPREEETLLSSESLAKLTKDIHAAKAWLILDLKNLQKYLLKKMSRLLNLSKEGVTDHLNIYSGVHELSQ